MKLVGADERTILRQARRVGGVLGRHWVALSVLAAGFALRLAVQVIYPVAFFYPDSTEYVLRSLGWKPFYIRPMGYSIFLKPFTPGTLVAVVVVQHLMVLALGVAIYVFLVRRGVARWIAAMALVPLALDARHVTVEHLVLAEALFITLTVAGLLLLVPRGRLGVLGATAAGLLLGAAALTRTVGLPVCVLVLGYLLIKRVGWRPLLGSTLAMGTLLGGYLVYYHHYYGVYAFGQYQGRFLYARVAAIADCDHIQLTPRERTLCPDIPVSERERSPDTYLWSPDSPAKRLYRSTEYDPLFSDFAKAVITQQPGDYMVTVVRETYWHFLPDPPLDAYTACGEREFLLPERPNTRCSARLYTGQPSATAEPPDLVGRPATAQTIAMARYSSIMTTPRPLLAACIALVLAAALWRPRQRWRESLEAILFTGCGFGLIVVSVATSSFWERYALPAVVLLPVGAALAIHRVHQIRATKPSATAAPAAGDEQLMSQTAALGAQVEGANTGQD